MKCVPFRGCDPGAGTFQIMRHGDGVENDPPPLTHSGADKRHASENVHFKRYSVWLLPQHYGS